MPDITYTQKAVVRRAAADAVPGKGDGPNLKVVTATKAIASASATNTIKFQRLESGARLHGLSKVYWDDLASSGSPTLSIGLAPVNSNFTAVNNALNSGLDISAVGAALGANLISDHANFGKTLWELAGLASDPGGQMDVYVTVVAAPINLAGDLTIEVCFTID